jgi:murein DD-endopeptidase MepM/ murein hydrolase activator NlpD
MGSDPVEAKRINLPIAISPLNSGEVTRDAEALSSAPELGRTTVIEVQRGDNMALIFAKAGIPRSYLQKLVEADKNSNTLTDIYPGQAISFRLGSNGELHELQVPTSPIETRVFLNEGGTFRATHEVKQAQVRRAFRHAVVTTSLYEAGLGAGLSHRMILDLANVLGGVIDFALDPRAGDRFSVLFEERYVDGEKVGEGSIIAAEYVNAGRTHTAYRFVDSSGRQGYFSEDGVSMRKAFLRSPLDFTRVTSNFNPRRLHPVAKVVRPHRGVDYGAPVGTPVYASGDGKVIASGYSRGNGNYVYLQHAGNIVTRYLHLHKRLVRNGARVDQGQTIGTVGATGLATGPHLHYEFVVNGVHRNPRTVLDNLPRVRSLEGVELASFRVSVGNLQAQLATYTQAWALAVASAEE